MAEYLTTSEVARLLRIKQRKVYDLAASGELPCSKSMGKLLFDRDAVNAWVNAGMGASTAPAASPRAAPTPIANVLLGSHDPLLDWAVRESGSEIASWVDGSQDGLERFARREGIAAGLHLIDPVGGHWNEAAVRETCGQMSCVLVHWAFRERGLVVRPGSGITQLDDIMDRSVAVRQAGSGAQQLLGYELEKRQLAIEDLDDTHVARTESDAALLVKDDTADVTFGLRAMATRFGLDFVPVSEERFDLVVDASAYFDPPFQRVLGFVRTKAFHQRAASLGGYRTSNTGDVLLNLTRADNR